MYFDISSGQILIEETQSNVHLMMLSREMPPLSFEFQHLKIRQDALILSNDDLAFTLDESHDLFRKIRKLPLDPKQVRMIHSSTEGWIGGLILLSEYISQHPEFVRSKWISGDLPDRKSRQGMKEDAAYHLKMGFEIAPRKGYEHFIFLSPGDLSRVCLLALEFKVREAIDYATHLLSTRFSSTAGEELRKLSDHPDPETREMALQIRRTIHRSKAPHLRIETLGFFTASPRHRVSISPFHLSRESVTDL